MLFQSARVRFPGKHIGHRYAVKCPYTKKNKKIFKILITCKFGFHLGQHILLLDITVLRVSGGFDLPTFQQFILSSKMVKNTWNAVVKRSSVALTLKEFGHFSKHWGHTPLILALKNQR